jgi:hypothetical protein
MTNISRFIKIICHNYYKYLLDIIKKIYTEYIYDIQNVFLILFLFSSSFSVLYLILYPGADPGFVVRGGLSRRGVCGPLKIPSGSKAEPW